jgi:hypothetical protein
MFARKFLVEAQNISELNEEIMNGRQLVSHNSDCS